MLRDFKMFTCSSGGTDNQGLHVLLHPDSASGEAMPQLYVPAHCLGNRT